MEKKVYFKACDSDKFDNYFICTPEEAKQHIDYMIQSHIDKAFDDDENVLCFKPIELTQEEFYNLEEFQGF